MDSKVGGIFLEASSGGPMVILLLGASGFIGRHIGAALEGAGFHVIRPSHRDADFSRDFDARIWEPRLEGIDVVVNAVGIIREQGAQTFEAIHTRAPVALFEACAKRGIPVVQISAVGADAGATTEFHRSKKSADDALLALNVPSIVLLPSLVFGRDGQSAGLFLTLASLPVIPLPGGGAMQVQPVHVDDIAAAVVAIVRERNFPRARMALVGPRALAFRDYLAELRSALGLGPARYVAIPAGVMEGVASLRIGALDPDSWRMLQRGNVANADETRGLLGREPRAVRDFVSAHERFDVAMRAKLGWLLPMLRVSLAAVWIAAGVLSAGIFPRDESLAMLERTHVTGPIALLALYGASAFDIAMGLGTLFLPRRRWLWILQAATIIAYTAIITAFLPEYWLHPFGPVVKNLPILAAIWLLYEMEKR
jgi:uncharacterized protein YbjT (DUF2867 family)